VQERLILQGGRGILVGGISVTFQMVFCGDFGVIFGLFLWCIFGVFGVF
jgi:hypothetical protein